MVFVNSIVGQDFPSALADRECIVLDLSESVEKENSHFVYRWDFGDGSQANGITAEHCYDSIGVFQATLSILDPISSKNFEEEFTQTIQIVPAVELVITNEQSTHQYKTFTAELKGFDGAANFYWSYSDSYETGKVLPNIRVQSGDKIRVLASFNFQGDEIFLAKEIEINETL